MAAMQLDELAHHGESDPGAARYASSTTFEGLPDPLAICCWNSRSLIFHRDLDAGAAMCSRDAERLAGRAIAHGVVEQIYEDAPDRIAVQGGGVGPSTTTST